jgi:hypothetical protein
MKASNSLPIRDMKHMIRYLQYTKSMPTAAIIELEVSRAEVIVIMNNKPLVSPLSPAYNNINSHIYTQLLSKMKQYLP